MLRLPSYLQKHPSGIFYFRMAIPDAFKPILQRREWKVSLKTRDPKQAKQAARFLALHAESLLRQLDVNAMGKKQAPTFKLIIAELIRQTDGTVKAKGVQMDPDKAEAEIKLLEAITGASTPPKTSTGSSETLSTVIDEYCQDKKREGSWTKKTEQENQAILDLLTRIVGDVPIAGITAQNARDYKKTLLKLPPNINKNPLYRSKTIEQVLAMHPEKVMSQTTVKKNLNRVKSFFDWAERHSHIDKNYFSGLTPRSKKKASEDRAIFTRDDLKAIFSHPIYSSQNHKHPYCYWLPLLGLYTGARIEELCQLHLDDIYEKEGVWVLDINDSGDKKLKNLSSKRSIPIHGKLIELGFLDYTQKLKKTGNTRLFPELKKQRDGYSQAASKWFGRLRKELGLYNLTPKKDFHSFRHTLTTELKNKSIPEPEVAAITGHSSGSITFTRYGKDYDIGKLQSVISHLEFDDVLVNVKPFNTK